MPIQRKLRRRPPIPDKAKVAAGLLDWRASGGKRQIAVGAAAAECPRGPLDHPRMPPLSSPLIRPVFNAIRLF
jgi:hypothetical protein